MRADQATLQAAIQAHQTGNLVLAERLYRQLLVQAPQSASLWKWLGAIRLQQDQPDEAVSYLRRSLELDPGQADAQANLGTALQAVGQYQEAIPAFEEALRLRPGMPEARKGLGDAWVNLGESHIQVGRYVAAEQALARAALVTELGMGGERARIHVAEVRGDWKRAEALLQDLWRRVPRDDIRLREAMLLPRLYEDEADLLGWRRRYQEKVEALAHERLVFPELSMSLVSTPFRLAYQGMNDLALQETVSGIFRQWLPKGGVEPGTRVPKRRRPRLVFVSAFFRQHAVMACFGRLITGMAGLGFEVVVCSAAKRSRDAETERIARGVDRFVELPRDLEKARRALSDLLPDIVVFTDLGMDLGTYCLAHTRYAPIQAVLPGHPVTTGISTIDYFVSSAWSEEEDAKAHYSETLIRLMGQYVDYPVPLPLTGAKTRSALGLPEKGNLYVCPVTLFKLLPSFDQALAAILQQDEQGWVVLIRLPETNLHEQFLARFRHRFGALADRICFLPWLPLDEWRCLLAHAAVVLDPFHFSGGNTVRMALAMGIPVVTWPSQYLRGRIAYGLYRRMGYLGCVAPSSSDYAALACRMAQDDAARAAAVAAIQEAGGVLLENDEGTRELAALLASWIP